MCKNFVIIHSCTKVPRRNNLVNPDAPFWETSGFAAMSKFDTNSHHISIGNIKDAKWIGPRTNKFMYEMFDKKYIFEDSIKVKYSFPDRIKINYDLLERILNSNVEIYKFLNHSR